MLFSGIGALGGGANRTRPSVNDFNRLQSRYLSVRLVSSRDLNLTDTVLPPDVGQAVESLVETPASCQPAHLVSGRQQQAKRPRLPTWQSLLQSGAPAAAVVRLAHREQFRPDSEVEEGSTQECLGAQRAWEGADPKPSDTRARLPWGGCTPDTAWLQWYWGRSPADQDDLSASHPLVDVHLARRKSSLASVAVAEGPTPTVPLAEVRQAIRNAVVGVGLESVAAHHAAESGADAAAQWRHASCFGSRSAQSGLAGLGVLARTAAEAELLARQTAETLRGENRGRVDIGVEVEDWMPMSCVAAAAAGMRRILVPLAQFMQAALPAAGDSSEWQGGDPRSDWHRALQRPLQLLSDSARAQAALAATASSIAAPLLACLSAWARQEADNDEVPLARARSVRAPSPAGTPVAHTSSSQALLSERSDFSAGRRSMRSRARSRSRSRAAARPAAEPVHQVVQGDVTSAKRRVLLLICRLGAALAGLGVGLQQRRSKRGSIGGGSVARGPESIAMPYAGLHGSSRTLGATSEANLSVKRSLSSASGQRQQRTSSAFRAATVNLGAHPADAVLHPAGGDGPGASVMPGAATTQEAAGAIRARTTTAGRPSSRDVRVLGDALEPRSDAQWLVAATSMGINPVGRSVATVATASSASWVDGKDLGKQYRYWLRCGLLLAHGSHVEAPWSRRLTAGTTSLEAYMLHRTQPAAGRDLSGATGEQGHDDDASMHGAGGLRLSSGWRTGLPAGAGQAGRYDVAVTLCHPSQRWPGHKGDVEFRKRLWRTLLESTGASALDGEPRSSDLRLPPAIRAADRARGLARPGAPVLGVCCPPLDAITMREWASSSVGGSHHLGTSLDVEELSASTTAPSAAAAPTLVDDDKHRQSKKQKRRRRRGVSNRAVTPVPVRPDHTALSLPRAPLNRRVPSVQSREVSTTGSTLHTTSTTGRKHPTFEAPTSSVAGGEPLTEARELLTFLPPASSLAGCEPVILEAIEQLEAAAAASWSIQVSQRKFRLALVQWVGEAARSHCDLFLRLPLSDRERKQLHKTETKVKMKQKQITAAQHLKSARRAGRSRRSVAATQNRVHPAGDDGPVSSQYTTPDAGHAAMTSHVKRALGKAAVASAGPVELGGATLAPMESDGVGFRELLRIRPHEAKVRRGSTRRPISPMVTQPSEWEGVLALVPIAAWEAHSRVSATCSSDAARAGAPPIRGSSLAAPAPEPPEGYADSSELSSRTHAGAFLEATGVSPGQLWQWHMGARSLDCWREASWVADRAQLPALDAHGAAGPFQALQWLVMDSTERSDAARAGKGRQQLPASDATLQAVVPCPTAAGLVLALASVVLCARCLEPSVPLKDGRPDGRAWRAQMGSLPTRPALNRLFRRRTASRRSALRRFPDVLEQSKLERSGSDDSEGRGADKGDDEEVVEEVVSIVSDEGDLVARPGTLAIGTFLPAVSRRYTLGKTFAEAPAQLPEDIGVPFQAIALSHCLWAVGLDPALAWSTALPARPSLAARGLLKGIVARLVPLTDRLHPVVTDQARCLAVTATVQAWLAHSARAGREPSLLGAAALQRDLLFLKVWLACGAPVAGPNREAPPSALGCLLLVLQRAATAVDAERLAARVGALLGHDTGHAAARSHGSMSSINAIFQASLPPGRTVSGAATGSVLGGGGGPVVSGHHHWRFLLDAATGVVLSTLPVFQQAHRALQSMMLMAGTGRRSSAAAVSTVTSAGMWRSGREGRQELEALLGSLGGWLDPTQLQGVRATGLARQLLRRQGDQHLPRLRISSGGAAASSGSVLPLASPPRSLAPHRTALAANGCPWLAPSLFDSMQVDEAHVHWIGPQLRWVRGDANRAHDGARHVRNAMPAQLGASLASEPEQPLWMHAIYRQ